MALVGGMTMFFGFCRNRRAWRYNYIAMRSVRIIESCLMSAFPAHIYCGTLLRCSRTARAAIIILLYYCALFTALPAHCANKKRGTHCGCAKIPLTKSLPVDSRDSGIGTLGGTEARCLVAMDHKLYAGIGYWMDSEHGNPRLPGAQILRLDSPGTDWKVDLQLDERLITGKPGRTKKISCHRRAEDGHHRLGYFRKEVT